jgi:hypothetical protein
MSDRSAGGKALELLAAARKFLKDWDKPCWHGKLPTIDRLRAAVEDFDDKPGQELPMSFLKKMLVMSARDARAEHKS